MATSYALPLNGAAPHIHSGHGNIKPQHRKAVPDRLLSAHTPTSGTSQMISESSSVTQPTSVLRSSSHSQSRHLPQRSSDDHIVPQYEHQNNTQFTRPQEVKSPSLLSPNTATMGTGHTRSFHALPRVQSSVTFPEKDGYSQVSPSSAGGRSSRALMTRLEAVSSILIPLPFTLVSLLLQTSGSQQLGRPIDLDLGEGEYKPTSNVGFISDLLPVFITTSITLLLVGAIGKILGKTEALDRRKRSHSSLGHRDGKSNSGLNIMTLDSIRRIFSRVAAIGLPVFAAMSTGGTSIAVILLIAVVGDLANTQVSISRKTTVEKWWAIAVARKWIIIAIVVQIVADLIGINENSRSIGVKLLGYLVLATSVVFLPPPYSMTRPQASVVTSPMPKSAGKTSALSTHWEAPREGRVSTMSESRTHSPLIATTKDTNLTIVSAILAIAISATIFLLQPLAIPFSSLRLRTGLLISAVAALSLTFAHPQSLMTERKFGLAIGLVLPLLVQETIYSQAWFTFACQGVIVGFFWLATELDNHLIPNSAFSKPSHTHQQHTVPNLGPHSQFTDLLLYIFKDWSLLHSILVEKDSRRIFYFMNLNLAFMFVQGFYGVVTGSLGLLSDSVHMFFDCIALGVGLCAAVMSKWPPSIRFPYGFGKMDTLAGFANGVFLLLVSIEIIYEAVERLVEGSQMQRLGELLTVSSLGLVVNLVGMFAFGHAHHGHGHDHSHGGPDHLHGSHGHSHEKSHDHAHENHDHSHQGHKHSHATHDHSHPEHSHYHEDHHLSASACNQANHANSHSALHQHHQTGSSPQEPATPLLSSDIPATPSRLISSNDHGHTHHHHGNENMYGIYLHILADTLGSVAVVISTILIHYTGWAGFDPLASSLIAILIFASAIPLVTSSAKRLLLTVPEDTEFDLREALAGVGLLRGVSAVSVPRFWMVEGEQGGVQGVMHVVAGRGVEMEEARGRAVSFLADKGMDVLVQVEREGDGRCWCGGAGNIGGSNGITANGVAPRRTLSTGKNSNRVMAGKSA